MELKELMNTIGAEARAGQTDTLMAHLHPRLIKMFGGDAGAKAVLAPMLDADLGLGGPRVTKFILSQPDNIRIVGEWTFALVPSTVVLQIERHKVAMVSFTLAARKRGNESKWFLVRGKFAESRARQIVPELPADYPWPKDISVSTAPIDEPARAQDRL